MAKKVELTWTVLPNGRSGAKTRATLYISPRLSGGKKLSDFPQLQNWPSQIIDEQGNWKASFNLRFSGSKAPIRVVPVKHKGGDRKTYTPDRELWEALFPPDTFVRSYEFNDLSERRIHSFPIQNIKKFIDNRYKKFAVTSPAKLPKVKTLLKDKKLQELSVYRPVRVKDDKDETLLIPGMEPRDYAALARSASKQFGEKVTASELMIADMRRHVREEVNEQFTDPVKGKLKAIPARPPNARNDFMQLKRFNLGRTVRGVTDKIDPPQMDFHQMVAAYGQHPSLLRLLGLAIDVEWEGSPPGDTGLVSLEVTPRALQTQAPQTNYRYSSGGPEFLGFQPRTKDGSEYDACCLRVGKSEYSLVSLDISGAGEKSINLSVDLQRISANRSAETKKRTGLPSLQSAGISLVRTGRAEFTVKLFEQQRKLNYQLVKKKEVGLWADDLLRGYRIDVHDGTSGEWRSLCRRKTTYTRTDNGMNWFEDYQGNDGWVSLAVTESTDKDDDDLHLQESLFRWNGWSLVAPRPGKTLSNDYKSVSQESEAAQKLNIKFHTEPAKGSLPRLRFGMPYMVRARAVDLAGNSITLEEGNQLSSGPQGKQIVVGEGFIYRRYEPVAQPFVLPHTSLAKSNGESVEHLVIRSYNYKPDMDKKPTSETTQRHIVPTGTSQQLAEAYGQFDDVNGRPQPAAYKSIIGHDNPLPKKDYYNESQIKLTYLPDPAAKGAAFIDIPVGGAANNNVITHQANGKYRKWSINPPPDSKRKITVHQVDFGPSSTWPDLKSFRLNMAGTITPRDPVWDTKKRQFTVFLQPGETRKVKLSSYVSEGDLNKFETWQWLVDAKDDNKLKSQVLAGLHWMMTPYRELTLVHAVQQPLLTPQFQKLRSHRKVGETGTILEDRLPIDGHSTSKIDVHAKWMDIDDTGEKPIWFDGRAHAFEMTINYTDTKASFGPKRTNKYIQVNPRNLGLVPSPKRLKLHEQEKQKIFQELELKPKKKTSTSPAIKTKARAASAQTISKKTAVQSVKPPKSLTRVIEKRSPSHHEFGDTRYRKVTYNITATTRYLEYMSFYQEYQAFRKQHNASLGQGKQQPDLVLNWEKKRPKNSFTRRSIPVTINVLSSARPPAPEIEYIIPTFGWERSKEGQKITSTRRGGGLRVYLRRPWFRSGAGELLGVVVGMPQTRGLKQRTLMSAVSSTAMRPYITQWGMDPIWLSEPTESAWTPGLNNFNNTYKTESNLTLDEIPGARVAVAGYVVGWWDKNGKLTGYDEERQLWYCDIIIDPGQSYFPFVRLALTRYQPNSISWGGKNPGDVKLSRVVLADFAQLAPNRFASVTFTSDTVLNIAVTGYTYSESGADKYATQTGKTRVQSANKTLRTRNVEAKQIAKDPSLVSRLRSAVIPQNGGSTVEVSLETSLVGGNEPLAWSPVMDSTVSLKRNIGKNGWFGQITLPEPRGSRKFRLVIKEYEWFIQDETGASQIKDSVNMRTEPRLVYADILEI